MKIGIGIGEMSGKPASLPEVVEQARQAELDGFATAWAPNIFGIDGITVCALAGQVTERIELGTAVVPSYPRHPTTMAQQALTANAACNGRFTLGIGLSHPVVVEQILGMSYDKPFTHMREYVEVIAPLLRGEAVSYQGDEFRVQAQLGFSGSQTTSLMLAALAPRMLGLAGAQTDGTITWMTGVKTIGDHVAPRIREAAERAGRPAPRVVCGLPIAVTDDPAHARELAEKFFVVYGTLPSYKAMLEREGVDSPGGVAMVGSEEQLREQLGALEKAGATDFLAAPFPVEDDSQTSLARTRAFLKSLI